MPNQQQPKQNQKPAANKPAARPRRRNRRQRAFATNGNNQASMTSSRFAPVSKSISVRSGRPRITTRSAECTVVTHREYISDLSALNASFIASRISINPGLNATFPWLSSIAERFESYIFRRLHFVYQPIAPTSTPGSIMMAIDFDAADPTPSNKISLMAYSGAVRSSPWEETRFIATSADLKKFGVQRYVRTGVVPTGTDIKTYDVGAFYIASQATPPAATTLGELYVEYDIELYTPQLTNSITATRESQRGAITFAPVTVEPVLTSIISGIANNPLWWIYKNYGNGTLDLVFRAAGNYLVTISSFAYLATMWQNQPTNFIPKIDSSTNWNTFWRVNSDAFPDQNNGSPVGSLTSRTYVFGNPRQSDEAVGDSPLYTVVRTSIVSAYRADGGTLNITMTPIDGPTASSYNDQRLRAPFPYIFGNWPSTEVIIPPNLAISRVPGEDAISFDQSDIPISPMPV